MITRFLIAATAVGAVAALALCLLGSVPVDGDKRTAGVNPIVLENQRPGTDEWRIARGSTARQIEAFASTTSAAPTEVFDVFVNVSSDQNVTWQVFRMGYYQGHGARLVASGGPAAVSRQPECPVDTSTGLIECAWTAAFQIAPASDWVTGQYLIKLRRADGFETYVPILIREASPRAPMLVQASVTTYQAYNIWGGASLYDNDVKVTKFNAPRAYRVSFDRPYSGNGSGQLFSYEVWMIRWLEQRGYDVAYATNMDIEAWPALVQNRLVFLSVGHDEYWSVGERDAVESARDAGVSLVFLSANTAYWRIRLEESSGGVPRRILTCYKDSGLDPLGKTPEATTLFRSQPFARPENGLMGVMYETWTSVDAFPLVVTNPTHWLYAGMDVAAGETLSHVVGYEWDHIFDNGFTPPTLEVAGHTMAIGTLGNQVPMDMVVYYPGAGNLVFSSGTIEWAWGLSNPDYVDPRIQRLTENVLARAGLPVDAPTEVPPLGPPAEAGAPHSAVIVAGTGEGGYADGPVETAQFNVPAGVAAAPDGTLYVTDARNHRVRTVTADGVVSTLAGCGPNDASLGNRFRDGMGADACFSLPTGIAIDASGKIYVSDTGHNCIRAIDPTTKAVTTWAGATAAGDADASDRAQARFSSPRGLAVGPDGAIYVADAGNGKIRRIGASEVTTVAAGLGQPTGVAVGPDGTVYAIETSPPRIGRIPVLEAADRPKFGPREVLAGGRFGDTGGAGAAARLRPSEGMIFWAGRLIFSDTANYRVRSLELNDIRNVTTVVGDGRFGQGTGGSARVVLPRGIAATADGFVVADSGNHRLLYVQP